MRRPQQRGCRQRGLMDTSDSVHIVTMYDPQACIWRIVAAGAHGRADEILASVPARIPSHAWHTEVIEFASRSEYATRSVGPFGLVLYLMIADYHVAIAILVHDSDAGVCRTIEAVLRDGISGLATWPDSEFLAKVVH